MYFYRKGRGRYKAAPEESLRAALASVERKRLQAEQKARYVEALTAFQLPEAFAPALTQLLYAPDKNSVEWKAVEEACAAVKLTPPRLLKRCGAAFSEHDFHLGRFLFECFPGGTGFPALAREQALPDLPVADVRAFSIDDAMTTEIDDAFSVSGLSSGGWRVGVHIALPALGITPDSELDRAARERLSTVYFPGDKITMLPAGVIDEFTLAAGALRPALSFYIDVAADFAILRETTRVERIAVAENLRHDALEPVFNEQTVATGIDHAYGQELQVLWRFASALERARLGEEPEAQARPEYSFYADAGGARRPPPRRPTPMDKVVSELMIHVNSAWGRELAESGIAGIYRVQTNGKVRMSTVAAEHAGLGVAQYMWASSPLRRYVDLINQRQIVAWAMRQPAPYAPKDERLLAAMRDFELAYDAYAEFQRNMERYWCLRWLMQEARELVTATVLRESLVRFDELPLVARVPSLPDLPPGEAVEIAVGGMDLFDLSLQCEFRRRAAEPFVTAAD
jgi:exoribonuclease-2